jgi:hypothetical protein
MTIRSLFRHEAESASYWGQWFLLQMFGPATQDSETDPIQILKRKYHRDR